MSDEAEIDKDVIQKVLGLEGNIKGQQRSRLRRCWLGLVKERDAAEASSAHANVAMPLHGIPRYR